MKIVSILLLIASAFLSIKHGWDAFLEFPPKVPQKAKANSV